MELIIHNGSPFAVSSGRMQSGTLTIGGTNTNYGAKFYSDAAWSVVIQLVFLWNVLVTRK